GPTDDFSYTLTPGGSTATVAVTVTCSNDPPVLTVPPSIPVVADTTNTLTGISASDVDAGNGNVTLNLSVPTPALAATGSGGVTVTGNTTALTLSGSLSALNSFIAGGNVSYTFNAYEITSTATGSGPLGTVIGDIDGDGQADIATANSNANSVSVLRNTSAGSITFAAPNDFSTGTNPRSIAAADLDGDGKLDLAVPNSNGNNSGPSTVSVLRNTSTAGAVSF
ncbi:MAG: VCBS repeat-containing protein, partial [Candidatus Competibacteraceae bacterium]|nr:VCBS repeat-containing protein [Candidatus Competibacteraceae bacterium]